MKKKNILTIVLVLLAAASVVFAFYMKQRLEYQKANPTENIGKTSTRESADEEIITELRHENPLIKARLNGYFYSFEKDGKITFYKFEKNELKEVTKGIKTVDFSVSMSDDEIKAKLYYLENDGKKCGYAVFNSASDSSVKVYTFVLFELVTLENGDDILLVNSDPSTAYNNFRTWDDIFEIDLKTGDTERYLSERNRGVDMTGARRRDFFVTTESSVLDFGEDILFFSSRDYQADDENEAPTDIYRKSGSTEEKIIEGAKGYFVASDGNDLLYIKETNTGFMLMKYFADEEIEGLGLVTFEGDYDSAYARCGNYLLDKENGVVYSLIDGSHRELQDYSISAMTFSISDDGNTVLLTGTVTNALEYGIYTYDFKSGKSALYIDESFVTLFNPTFIDNSHFAYTYSDGAIYKTVVAKV